MTDIYGSLPSSTLLLVGTYGERWTLTTTETCEFICRVTLLFSHFTLLLLSILWFCAVVTVVVAVSGVIVVVDYKDE